MSTNDELKNETANGTKHVLPEVKMGKRKFVYRLQEPVKPNVRTFEIGIIDEPTSNFRKEYPDSWCDARICEGFWGDEKFVSKVVETLNAHFNFG
jgi:hypothetical protein